jgi:uncharacterized protein YkwD
METLKRRITLPLPVLALLLILPAVLAYFVGQDNSSSNEVLSGALVAETVPMNASTVVSTLNASRTPALVISPALTQAAQTRSNDRANNAEKDMNTYLNQVDYVRQSYSYFTITAARRPLADTAFGTQLAGNAAMKDSKFLEIGVAVAKDTAGNFYYTAIVALPENATAPGVNLTDPSNTAPNQNDAIVLLLNNARNANGLCPLVSNAQLIAAAQAHANEMSQFGFLDHTGKNGSTVLSRMTAAGYAPITQSGENILSRNTINAGGAFNGWWNSPPHYANMMNNVFTEVGVAYAGPSPVTGLYYYAMVLGNRGTKNGCELAAEAAAQSSNTSSGNTTTSGNDTSAQPAQQVIAPAMPAQSETEAPSE